MAEPNSTAAKLCSKCGEIKPLSSFYKTSPKAISAPCKPCSSIISLQSYHRRQEDRKAERARELEKCIASPVKQCSRCRLEKPKADFGRDDLRRDGLKALCRPCHNASNAEVRQRNPQVGHLASARWKAENPDKWRESCIRRGKRVERRVHGAISSRVRRWLKDKENRKTAEILGYGWDELRPHLERQFLKGMSWSNYGEWQIDHIVPLALFDVTGPHDPRVRQAWALTNLRPLWARDNRVKNAKRTHLI